MLVEIDGVVEVLTERSESGKGTFITSFFHGRDLIAKVNMIQLTKTPRMSGLFDTFREVSS